MGKLTLTQYVIKHGGVDKSAMRIGIDRKTLSRHLHGHHKPISRIIKARLTSLGIDLTNYPGEEFVSKNDPRGAGRDRLK